MLVELRELPQPKKIKHLERQTAPNRSIVFQLVPSRLANPSGRRSTSSMPDDGHAICVAPTLHRPVA